MVRSLHSRFSALVIYVTAVWVCGQFLYGGCEANAQHKPAPQLRSNAPTDAAAYMPGRVKFRIQPQYYGFCTDSTITYSALTQVLSDFGNYRLYRAYPSAQAPKSLTNAAGDTLVDITRVYEVHYLTENGNTDSTVNVLHLADKLAALPAVRYAEPHYIDEAFFVPNDPRLETAYWPNLIRAYDAWDITQGDTSIIIGVVDTGFDLEHPDLAAAVARNNNDPIDGIDNDLDGYIDNYEGWDFVGGVCNSPRGDNDPRFKNLGSINHGSMVAGCACARTNDGIGTGSPGFKARWLPVKVTGDNCSTISFGYEGIIYAADMGAKIINCSFGSFVFSQARQDVVNYATFNRGALVVAAAGNDRTEAIRYPAGFTNVLAVAATDALDRKSIESNFHTRVDVSAPASAVVCPIWPSTYAAYNEGYTSHAAPMVASAAALVLARYPTYTPQQIAARLRSTADDIDAANPGRERKMGRGRINLYRAVTDTTPAIRNGGFSFTDGNNNIAEQGDTLTLTFRFENLLDPSTARLGAKLVSLDTNQLVVIHDTATIGALQTLQDTFLLQQTFRVVVRGATPLNTSVTMRLDYTDSNYTDFDYASLLINPSFYTMDSNRVHATFTSNGLIGYNDYPRNAQGIGVTVDGLPKMLYEGGFLLGTSTTQVLDVIRDGRGAQNRNFITTTPLKLTPNGTIADLEGHCAYKDDSSNAIRVSINQSAYQWAAAPDSNYIIITYTIRNRDSLALSNVYAGIFTDWDILDYNTNLTGFDSDLRIGYCTDLTGSYYTGVTVLNGGGVYSHSFRPTAASQFTTAYKFNSLSGQNPGSAIGPTDVAQYVSTGPFTVAAGDSITLAFALIGGTSTDDLVNGVLNARWQYACKVRAARPHLGFNTDTARVTESGGTGFSQCRPFRDVSFPLVTDAAPEAELVLGVTATDNTTTQGVDYDVLTPTLTFPAGNAEAQYITVRVYYDTLYTETDESFTLDFGLISGDIEVYKSCQFPQLTIVIANNATPAFSLQAQGATTVCAGNTVTLTVTGTTPSLSRMWVRDGILLPQADTALAAGQSGSYAIILRDTSGCADTLTAITVTIQDPPVFDTELQHIGTFGTATGAVQVRVRSGLPPFRFTLSGRSTQDDSLFTQLTAGSYTLTVTDALGCTATQTLTLTQPPIVQCIPPPNFLVTEVTAVSARFVWRKVPDATQYRLRYRALDGIWVNITITDTSHLRLNLTPNTSYQVQVASRCGTTNTSYTPVVEFRTAAAVLCPMPTGLGLTSLSSTAARIVWQDFAAVTAWQFYYRRIGDPTWVMFTIGNTSGINGGTVSYELKSLVPLVAYEVRVGAVCGSTASQISQSIAFTTPAAPCVPPGNIRFSGTAANGQILWDAAAGARSYVIQVREKRSGASWVRYTSTTNALALTGLVVGQWYQVRIRTNCGAGVLSDFAAIVEFRPTNPFARDEANSAAFSDSCAVLLYPNPTQNQLNIAITLPSTITPQAVTVHIYSVEGKHILTKPVTEMGTMTAPDAVIASLDVTGLSAGMYYMTLTAGGAALFAPQRFTVLPR